MIFNTIKNWFFRKCSLIAESDKSFDVSEYMRTITQQPAFILPISKKIKACQNISMSVYKKTDSGKTPVENHVLNDVFKMINPNTSFNDFLDYFIVWLDSTNNGVLLELITGIPSMRPDLYIYNPNNFTVYMRGRNIERIEIRYPHKTLTGDALKNFIWIRNPDYQNNVDGINSSGIGTGYSKQNAVAIYGSYSKKAWIWNHSIATNLGKPSGILRAEGSVDKDDREEIRAKYSAHYGGADNAGKPMVLGSGLTWQDTSKNPIDTDWATGEQKAHERAAIAIGVPAELVGGGDSTYENRKHAKKELYKEGVIPFFNNLKIWLTFLLKGYLKNGEFIDYDLTGADELKDEIGEIIRNLEPLKNRVTINEYRRIISKMTDLDLDDIEGGNVLMINSSEIPIDEAMEPVDVSKEKEDDL